MGFQTLPKPKPRPGKSSDEKNVVFELKNSNEKMRTECVCLELRKSGRHTPYRFFPVKCN